MGTPAQQQQFHAEMYHHAVSQKRTAGWTKQEILTKTASYHLESYLALQTPLQVLQHIPGIQYDAVTQQYSIPK